MSTPALTLDAVQQALSAIRTDVALSSCSHARTLSKITGSTLYVKCEVEQLQKRLAALAEEREVSTPRRKNA